MAAEVGIELNAFDNTAPKMAAASRSADSLAQKYKSLTPMIGRSTGALMKFGSAAGAIDGPIGGIIRQVVGLASMLTGPLGIAMAAITLAVGAASLAWKKYQESAERARAEQKRLADEMTARREDLRKYGETVNDVVREIQALGQSTKEMQMHEAFEAQYDAVEKLEAAQRAMAEAEAESFAVRQKTASIARGQLSDMAKAEQAAAQEREHAAAQELIIARKSHDLINAKITALKDYELKAKNLKQLEEDRITQERRKEEAIKKRAEAEKHAAAEAERIYKEERARALKLHKLEFDYQQKKAALAEQWAHQRLEIAARVEEDEAKLRLKQQEELRASLEATEASALATGQAAMRIGDAFGVTFSAIITGAQSAGEALGNLAILLVDTVIDAVSSVIIAEAAKAAASAASGMFAIPFVGPALAAGAAGVAFGMVKGMLSLLPRAQHGGVLTSGSTTGDMNIVRMNRNELTMPPDVASAFRRIMAAEEGHGVGLPQDKKPTVVQNVTYRSVGPLLSADTQRSARTMAKLLRRAHGVA